MQHEVERAEQVRRRRQRDVPAAAIEGEDVVFGERLRQCVPELAARAGDQDAADRSLAERVGVAVLQRCTTRGSFHGTPSSSGSAGSYSRETW